MVVRLSGELIQLSSELVELTQDLEELLELRREKPHLDTSEALIELKEALRVKSSQVQARRELEFQFVYSLDEGREDPEEQARLAQLWEATLEELLELQQTGGSSSSGQ